MVDVCFNEISSTSANANTGMRLGDEDVVYGEDGLPRLAADLEAEPVRAPANQVAAANDVAAPVANERAALPASSNQRGAGVVVPTGGLTKAILDRIR